jgi:hypothetical protein
MQERLSAAISCSKGKAAPTKSLLVFAFFFSETGRMDSGQAATRIDELKERCAALRGYL